MKAEWKEELPLEGIKDISPVSGGDVNEAFKVTTTEDDIFFYLFSVIDLSHSMQLKLLV